MPDSSNPVDLLIIGAGPTGLFGAFYAGMRKMSVKLVDSLDVLGGQLVTLYPEKHIYDVPGFREILAKDLAARLIDQAMQYHPAVCLGQQVGDLSYDQATGLYTVFTAHGRHHARAILISAGVGSFQPRLLPLPEARRFEGKGLHYCVRQLSDFADARVLIVGGGNSAVDWANAICPVAASTTLIHRHDRFRAHEESLARLRLGPTRIAVHHELKSLHGNESLESAVIYDNRSKAEQLIEVDHVLVNIGFVSSIGALKNWGLDLEGGAIRVDGLMRTSRPGIWAAGDMAHYPGKLKLIATGFAEACTAVNVARAYLEPASPLFPGHSSDMARPPSLR